jgi:hypothetical protein
VTVSAQVEISTEAGKQYATVTTASSYESSSDPRVHFGRGIAKSVNLIRNAGRAALFRR